MEPGTANVALHRVLRRAWMRGWLLGATLPLALAVATAVAIGGANAPDAVDYLHIWLGLLTGLTLACGGHVGSFLRRRSIRALPEAQLPPELIEKMGRVLEPGGRLQYPFTVHVSAGPGLWLCEMDGCWLPQLYLSRELLELWPEEHVHARVDWLRGKLAIQRNFFGGFYRQLAQGHIVLFLAAFPLFAAIVGQAGGYAPWQYIALVAGVLGLRAWTDTTWARIDRLIADRDELARLGHDAARTDAFIQSCVMYDWWSWPPAERGRRVRQRLRDMFADKQAAAEWVASYDKHLSTAPSVS